MKRLLSLVILTTTLTSFSVNASALENFDNEVNIPISSEYQIIPTDIGAIEIECPEKMCLIVIKQQLFDMVLVIK